METVNGNTDYLQQDSQFTATNNLGKRKRESEEFPEHNPKQEIGSHNGPLQDSMRATLQLLKK